MAGVVVAVAAVAGTLAATSGGPAGPAALQLRTVTTASAVASVTDGLGSGWLVDDRNDTLVRFDPGTGRSTGPAVKVAGRPVAVTTGFGRVWVASMLSDTVEEIAPGAAGSAGEVVRTVQVPEGPSGLAVLDGRVWVASVIAGDLTAVDAATGRVATSTHLPQGAVRLAAGSGRLWVTGTADTVAAVDPRPSGGRLQWRTVTVGSGPLGVAVGDGSVWVADATAGTVAEVDPSTYRVVHTFNTGPDPVAVAVSGGRTLVADGKTSKLTALPAADGTSGNGTSNGGRTVSATLVGTPRQLVAISGGVWAAVGNPGAVVAVRRADG